MIDYAAVKANISISDVLLKYGFQVPEHGRYAILCPFHIEKTASLHINNEKGLFNCFGCSASGSVIDLVARLDRISFKEAAQNLSSQYGISETNSLRIDARRIQSKVSAWITKPSDTDVSIPYELRDLPAGYRNLSKNVIEHFNLSLTDYGVFFPHYDLTGKIIGYSIRQADGVKPKYLNSKQFNKGIPYGAFQNKQAIIERGFCIVTEGQIDAARVWDSGYCNVVSLMGSSLTEPQGHLLLALTTKLLLLFDGDIPGRKGAAKTNRRWNSCFSMKIELLPNGYDPADWLKSNEL